MFCGGKTRPQAHAQAARCAPACARPPAAMMKPSAADSHQRQVPAHARQQLAHRLMLTNKMLTGRESAVSSTRSLSDARRHAKRCAAPTQADLLNMMRVIIYAAPLPPCAAALRERPVRDGAPHAFARANMSLQEARLCFEKRLLRHCASNIGLVQPQNSSYLYAVRYASQTRGVYRSAEEYSTLYGNRNLSSAAGSVRQRMAAARCARSYHAWRWQHTATLRHDIICPPARVAPRQRTKDSAVLFA